MRRLGWISIFVVAAVGTTAAGQGVISTVAGSDRSFPANITLALNTPLGVLPGVAVDVQGRIYLADRDSQRVFRVNPDGTIQTVAGNGNYGFSGDGGLATSASLYDPREIGRASCRERV